MTEHAPTHTPTHTPTHAGATADPHADTDPDVPLSGAQPQHHAAPRRVTVLQVAAAITVGAAVSHGALGALSPLLRGEQPRGVVVIGLLIAGAAMAVWAPFRLRGWPAAVCGSLACGAIAAMVGLELLPSAGDMLNSAQTLAAGFALGGVLSAAASEAVAPRGLAIGALTGGLTLGTWGSPLPYVATVFAVILGAAAAKQAPPPGRLSATTAPLAVLLTAILLACVLAGGPQGYLFVVFLITGPVAAGAVAWWLGPPRASS